MTPDLKQLWLNSLAHEKRASEHTISAYGRDADKIIESFEHLTESLSEHSLRAKIAHLSAHGQSPQSIARAMSAVKNFVRWSILRGHLPPDFALAPIKLPKARKKLPKVLDIDLAQKVVEVAANDDKGLRDHAIFELFYSTGLRLSELRNLHKTDLDFNNCTVLVRGKGNKQRLIPFGGHAKRALQAWLTKLDQSTYLFINLKSRAPLSTRGIQYIVEQRGKRLGLDQSLHPHLFRHACASHLLESSGDLRAVQELLGHENISTTQVYTHLNFQHLSEVYDKSHPRAKKKS